MGTVIYRDLDPGTFYLRVVAIATNGDKALIRRKFHAGRYCCLDKAKIYCQFWSKFQVP